MQARVMHLYPEQNGDLSAGLGALNRAANDDAGVAMHAKARGDSVRA